MAKKTGGSKLSGKNRKEQIRNEKALARRQASPERKEALSKKIELALLITMFIAVALVLFVGPFLRGLFFPREILWANLLLFGLLVVWGVFRILKQDGRLFNAPMDLCLAVLLLAYLVSFFVAVHKRDALTEVMKTVSYLIIYLVAIDLGRYFYLPWRRKSDQIAADPEIDRDDFSVGASLLLQLAMVSAMVLAIASLGVAAGHWDFPFAYDGRRIASPIGYANTAAAYLMAAYLLAIALAPLARKWWRLVCLAAATTMLITVILTFSRGAWLLLPPLALLLVIASAPVQRLRVFLYLLATTLPAVPLAILTDSIFQSGQPASGWLPIIGAALVAILLGYAAEFFIKLEKRKRLILTGSAVAALALVLFLLVGLPLLQPITLGQDTDSETSYQLVEQVIGSVQPGAEYSLSFEVDARPQSGGDEQADHDPFWGVKVLGGQPGYRYVDLLEVREGATDGWESRELSFQANDDADRLEVLIASVAEGGSVTIRSVRLQSGSQQEKLNFTASRVLPKRFYDRIFSYSVNVNMDRRFEIFGDALKVIRDYPLLGTGGRGWAALYKGYQDQHYSSRTVHNHFLEVWIEAGIFGFLAFVGIWVSFFVTFYRNTVQRKAPPRRWQYWAAALVPVAALGAHSLIDWNFTFAAVGLYLFVLIAAGNSEDQVRWFKTKAGQDSKKSTSSLLIGIVAIMVGVFLLIYNGSLIAGLHATWRSQEYVAQNNYKQALVEMEKGIRLDSLRADNYHNMSVLIQERVRSMPNQADVENMLFLARQAYELEPYNLNYLLRYGDLLLNFVDVEEGLAYLDRAIAISPFTESSYHFGAISRLNLAEYYTQTGHLQLAEAFIADIFTIAEKLNAVRGNSRVLNFGLGRAHQLLGEDDQAISYYEAVRENEQNYREAQQYLAELKGEGEDLAEDED